MPMTSLKTMSSQKMISIGMNSLQGWDPKMTRFKSMSLDEKMVILEQSGQETLGAREEMIAAEVAESPQVAAEAAEIP
jgi:hypothetical protein